MTLTLTPKTEARLQALVAQRNEAPEAVVDAALEALWQNAPMQDGEAQEATDSEQKRMRDLLASVQAQARLLPSVSPEQTATGSSPEEQAFGEIVAEKYRKQGFNV